MLRSGYDSDLAFIHDQGFSEFAQQSAPGILASFRRHGIRGGHVLDLGCGSGRWSRFLLDAGYSVTGVDQSASMIRLARRHANGGSFRVSSIWDYEFPPQSTVAVTALGEVVNYAFDRTASRADLRRLFTRVRNSLQRGGIFVFDFATPDRLPDQLPARSWFEGPDWAVLVETDGDRRRAELNRFIVTYRRTKGGQLYRRGEELHRLRLLQSEHVTADLESAGFDVTPLTSFGRYRFFPGMAAMLARRPR